MLKLGKRLQAVQDKVSVPFSGTSFSGQITSNVGYCLVGTAGDQEEHGSFELLVKTVAVVRGADVALARMTTWTYRSRTHQGLGSAAQPQCLMVMMNVEAGKPGA